MKWKEVLLAGGKVEIAAITKCETCDGSGKFNMRDRGKHRSALVYHQCMQCQGTGKVTIAGIDLNELIDFIRRQRN
jgi:DnaJ-class molecular chaperone